MLKNLNKIWTSVNVKGLNKCKYCQIGTSIKLKFGTSGFEQE